MTAQKALDVEFSVKLRGFNDEEGHDAGSTVSLNAARRRGAQASGAPASSAGIDVHAATLPAAEPTAFLWSFGTPEAVDQILRSMTQERAVIFGILGLVSSQGLRLRQRSCVLRRCSPPTRGRNLLQQFSAEQVRLATFELKNRGYNIDAVDGAMNRLEPFVNAIVRIPLRPRVRRHERPPTARRPCTRVFWRPRGERFAHPTSGTRLLTARVDDLLDRIAAYFDEAGG